MKTKLLGLIILLILIPVSYFLFDKNLSNQMVKIPEVILDIFAIITMFGSPLLIVACLGMLARFTIQRKLRKKTLESQLLYLFVPITVITSWGISHLLKFIFGRVRPSLYHSQELYGFSFFNGDHDMTSFPSGHTVLITSFLLSLIIFRPKLKWLGYLIILLIASSRIILDKHFLSDVLFGLAIGLIMVTLSEYVFNKFGILLASNKEKRC